MDTVENRLKAASPHDIADVLRLVDLSKMVEPTINTVTQTSAVTVTLDPPALLVQTIRVVTGSDTGPYHPGDSAATPVAPASGRPGTAAVSADGATVTLPSAATVVKIVYLARTSTPLSTKTSLGG